MNVPANLLESEEHALASAKAALQGEALGSGAAAFAELTQQYARLLRHTRHLIRVSDRMQEELNRINDRLQESEEKYRSLFENVHEGIFIARLDGQFLDVNPAMAQVLGCASPEDFLHAHQADPAWPFVEGDDQESLFNTLAMHGRVSHLQMRMLRQDGQPIWVEINAQVRPPDTRHPDAKVEGVFSDITERKRMLEELRHLATTDSLTGLCNRRHFLELCERELRRVSRYPTAIAMLMLDADHFKNINDTYGHDIGDQVLRIISRLCRAQVREVDVIGRMGGEELAILLPNTDFPVAQDIAERLRTAIAQTSLPLADGQMLRFTVSIGGCAFSGRKLAVDELLKTADQALYVAKNNGRNRVEMHQEAP
ncbi:MAG: Sensor diguanylate cyclase [Pseudomonadota bacterium]|nr:Sensor diguanylate cyclase [Pseudomonadota bacterium]